MKPAEILLFDYLTERIAAAAFGDTLFELELHDTVWQTIQTNRGIRISDAVSVLVPDSQGGMKEWDASLIITCYARVEGVDVKSRQPAVQAVFDIEQAVCDALYANGGSLGGRVCALTINPATRGYDNLDSKAYATVNIPIVINPSQ
ncbi:MAG: hypothetical protein JO314_11855 [Acidobacteria bacterium]|nr:hypothetical protein [Acidobacteriota bacterium]